MSDETPDDFEFPEVWVDGEGLPGRPPTMDEAADAAPPEATETRLTRLLRDMRKQAGLSQANVRDRSTDPDIPGASSIPASSLSDWETGKHTPTDDNLWKLITIYARQIPGANADQMYAHALSAKKIEATPHAWDLQIIFLADSLQALPPAKRAQMTWALHAILDILLRLTSR